MAQDERKYNGKQKQAKSGEPDRGFGDGASNYGKKNFRGPSDSKRGIGVAPHASGSPWSGGRETQMEKDYSKDYTRRGSQYGSGATGPKKPSDEISDAIYGGRSVDRGKQTNDHK